MQCFFLSIFSCCAKSGDRPQEDLAKSCYKTDREVENLGIPLHVGKPLDPITQMVSAQMLCCFSIRLHLTIFPLLYLSHMFLQFLSPKYSNPKQKH